MRPGPCSQGSVRRHAGARRSWRVRRSAGERDAGVDRAALLLPDFGRSTSATRRRRSRGGGSQRDGIRTTSSAGPRAGQPGLAEHRGATTRAVDVLGLPTTDGRPGARLSPTMGGRDVHQPANDLDGAGEFVVTPPVDTTASVARSTTFPSRLGPLRQAVRWQLSVPTRTWLDDVRVTLTSPPTSRALYGRGVASLCTMSRMSFRLDHGTLLDI